VAQYPVNIKAGKPVPIAIAGAYFTIMDPGSAGSIGVKFYDGSRELESINTAKRGFKARPASGRFTRVDLSSSIDTVAQIVISDGDIEIDVSDGASVTASIAGLPLPVQLDRGTPALPLNVVGLSLSDAPGSSIVDSAAVAVGSAAAVSVVAADANRRALRLANIGADPVAIGGAGITWAKRCIVIQPGDLWEEAKGANLQWFAICEATKTASVTAQGVMA